MPTEINKPKKDDVVEQVTVGSPVESVTDVYSSVTGEPQSISRVAQGKSTGSVAGFNVEGKEMQSSGLSISATGTIKGGQTAYNTGTGYWLSAKGTPQFSVGVGPTGNRITFDGTTITLAGIVTASQIHIPDTTTANSFHVSTGGDMWIGCNVSDFNASNQNAQIYFLADGTGFIKSSLQVGVSSGNYIAIDGANQRIRSSNYSAGVSGFTVEPDLIEAQNLRARGMLHGTTLQYDVVSAVGGQMMVANADTLDTDMTAADNSTMTITGETTFAVNDILLIRARTASGIQEEWFRVTNIASAPTYTVTRDLAGTYGANANPAWAKGTTVSKQGESDGAATYSGGWLRLLGEGTNSPHYSVFSRTGVAYNSYSEVARLGNVNGLGGVASESYGIFVGDYSNDKYLLYDTVGGDLVINGQVNGLYGFGGDGSDGALNVAAGTTTLNLDQIYNFSSITVAAGATLTFTGSGAAGVLNCKGDCTIAGTIELRQLVSTQTSTATRRDNLQTGNGIAFTGNTGGPGGSGGLGQGGDGGSGGTSTDAGDGSGGAGGTGNGGDGADGSGGGSVTGGGGGGGGAGEDGLSGSDGSSAIDTNGAAGGDGANGNAGSASGGGGGGGGGGYNTGNGGVGGAGGDGLGAGGVGGAGGDSGANGGNGGLGGAGGIGGAGGFSEPAGAGGRGGDGYTNGGNGGTGGNQSSGSSAGAGGRGGNGFNGTGGTGGTGGSKTGSTAGAGGRGGDGYTGGTGGTGGNTSGAGGIGGVGGRGGDGAIGAAAFVLYCKGDMNLNGMTVWAQGGNGGDGGTGGTNTGGVGWGGDGGNGGNGGNGADVVMLCLGTLSGSYTINNFGGNGGNGGAGGSGGTNGAVGNMGVAGSDGAQIISEVINT